MKGVVLDANTSFGLSSLADQGHERAPVVRWPSALALPSWMIQKTPALRRSSSALTPAYRGYVVGAAWVRAGG